MVKNFASVKGSIANAYLVREATFFCSHYFEYHVYRKSRNVPRNDDGSISTCNEKILGVFKYPGQLQGR